MKEIIKKFTLGSRTLIIHAEIYWPEKINTMLCTYALKEFSEQFNEITVDDDKINPMEKISIKTTYITP